MVHAENSDVHNLPFLINNFYFNSLNFLCFFICAACRKLRSLIPFVLVVVGGLSLIPPRSQGGGNILISNNIYPMDCDPPSVISIQQQPSVQMTLTPSSGINLSGGSTSVSLNVINQRYLQQHMHNNRNSRYNAPLSGHVQKSNYAPASLPIDLITASSGSAGMSGNVMVLPDHHSSLIIGGGGGGSGGSYHHPVSGYAPFTINSNDGNSIQLTHQNKASASSGRSGNTNSNNSNNNTTGDESMVGVCVQQSPVVIH